MANYQLLKADIDAKVYQNGEQEITGANLNAVLNAMVTTLGAEYQYAGVATIGTNPGSPDAKVFYIANGKGKYTNFGGLEVTEDDVVVLYWDTAWHKEATGIASQEKLSELEEQINGNIQVITPEFLPNYRYNLQRVVGDELRPFVLLESDNCDCVSIEVNGGDKVRIIATPQKSTTYAWTLTSRITSANSVIVKAIPNIGVAVDEVIDIVEDGILYVVCEIGSPRLLEISRKVDSGLKGEVSKIKTELGKVAPIYGKKVLFIGDSICAANEVDKILGGTDGGWAKRIGESYGLTYVNAAVGGQVVTENLYNQSGALTRSILTKFNLNHSKLLDAEYTIFDIGTNDADIIGYIVETKSDGTIGLKDKADYPSAFGTWNYSDFSGEYDTNTFCGAFEKYLHKTLTTYKGMKFGYIVAPKMALSQYSAYAPLRFANRKAYYDVAVSICKKWGVPVLNLWEDCWTNPFLVEHYDTTKTPAENISGGKYYLDGQHPTPTCYDYISPIIARWMESL